jgi:hypothetical protein
VRECSSAIQSISLADANERRAAFLRYNPELDFQFRDAVNERALVASNAIDRPLFHKSLRYTPRGLRSGGIAAAMPRKFVLSHLSYTKGW